MPWPKGRKRTVSNETCRKISEALKGRPSPLKGRKLPQRSPEHCRKISDARKGTRASAETRRKMSTSHLGLKHSEETKRKMCIQNKENQNPNWKGDRASVDGFHQWLRSTYGAPNQCDFCDGSERIEYAKKHGHNYTRNPENYHRLCVPCHRRYDAKPHTEEAKRKISEAKLEWWRNRA